MNIIFPLSVVDRILGGGLVFMHECMHVCKNVFISLYMYVLGSVITTDAKCHREIRRRIAIGKEAFSNRRELLRGKVNRTLKIRMIKTLIWSVVLYGAETWTMRKEDIKRLEAFEMWTWRRMEKVSWTEHKTNEEI